MPALEIRTPDRLSEIRSLSRRVPVAIGSHPASDITIEEEGIAPLHCRVGWNGQGYEVTAAVPEGVAVNGTIVRQKQLADGDVIRVGAVDVVLTANGAAKPAAPRAATPRPAAVDVAGVNMATADVAAVDVSRDDLAALGEGEAAASPADPLEKPMNKTPASERQATAPDAQPTLAPEDRPVLLDEPAAAGKSAVATASASGWRTSGKRPGEQDVLTSPLVLGFGGLALVLLLAAGTIWFLIGREGADRLYTAAVADQQAGRYTQAIAGYEEFVATYPTDGRHNAAVFALGRAQIERHTAGATPDWSAAADAFDAFVTRNRDNPEFDTQRTELRGLARTVSGGASASAVRTGKRSYLATAERGRKLYARYAAGGDAADEDAGRQLDREYAKAEAAVRKKEYFDASLTRADAAMQRNDFTTVFQTRNDLLTRYPDLASDRKLSQLLETTLKVEGELVRVTTDLPPQAASEQENTGDATDADEIDTDEAAGSLTAGPTLVLAGQSQARAGEVPDGRIVLAEAAAGLFGLDAVTGRPLWRQAIGLETPFFPLEVTAAVPSLLVYDRDRRTLKLLRREDGGVVWRTPVAGGAIGAPLVAEGQIDLATGGTGAAGTGAGAKPAGQGRLLRLDVETGRPLAEAIFPQPILGPPVRIAGAERLIVFGEAATAYTLDLRTLKTQAVSYLGHAAGAVAVPPQVAGSLVVLLENDRLESAQVRVLAFDAKSNRLKQVAAERVAGQIHRPPVLRGNVLVVPSLPERVTAFSLSDDPGRPPLTRLTGAELPDPQGVPTYLVAGPDGTVWAAGTVLRKLRLTADGWSIGQEATAPGRHTQPPQESGESLFLARTLPAGQAVYVSQADRQTLVGSWRTVLGAQVLAVASAADAAAVITDAGQVETITPQTWPAQGLAFANARSLPNFNDTDPAPLHGAALHDGRAVLWRGGAEPELWLVPPGGPPGRPQRLPGPLETAPIALDAGLVLPLAGRLELLSSAGTKTEAFLLPVTGGGPSAAPAWRSLARIDGERLAALDASGTLRTIALRAEPLPHLAEVAAVAVETTPSAVLVSMGDRLALPSGMRVQLFDPAGLRPVAQATLPAAITGGPWAVDDTLFVAAGNLLVAFDAPSLSERWRADLAAPAAGPPLSHNKRWLAASQTGRVVKVAADGSVRGSLQLHEPLIGLRNIAGAAVAISLGGTLHQLRLADDAVAQETP